MPHIAGELFGSKSGIPIRHVPYRGGAPALQDVIAGNVGLNFGTPLTKGNIDNGDVRALAVAAPKRIETLPNVPTFAEAGLPIPELDGGAWFGLLAPAGTPKDIVQKLSQHFNMRSSVRSVARPGEDRTGAARDEPGGIRQIPA